MREVSKQTKHKQ